jgi:hypothetical protein
LSGVESGVEAEANGHDRRRVRPSTRNLGSSKISPAIFTGVTAREQAGGVVGALEDRLEKRGGAGFEEVAIAEGGIIESAVGWIHGWCGGGSGGFFQRLKMKLYRSRCVKWVAGKCACDWLSHGATELRHPPPWAADERTRAD